MIQRCTFLNVDIQMRVWFRHFAHFRINWKLNSHHLYFSCAIPKKKKHEFRDINNNALTHTQNTFYTPQSVFCRYVTLMMIHIWNGRFVFSLLQNDGEEKENCKHRSGSYATESVLSSNEIKTNAIDLLSFYTVFQYNSSDSRANCCWEVCFK